MGLRNREVFVVSPIGDDRLADRTRCLSWQVRALRPPLRLAVPEMDAVALVELGRAGILRADAVKRVKVETRGTRLEQRRGRDIDVLHQRALVERQVMVEELAKIRVAGRDLPRRDIVDR